MPDIDISRLNVCCLEYVRMVAPEHVAHFEGIPERCYENWPRRPDGSGDHMGFISHPRVDFDSNVASSSCRELDDIHA